MTGSRLETLRKFLEDDPSDVFTRYAIALEYISAGDAPAALLAFEEVLRHDPAYVPAYHQMGLLLLRSGRAPEGRSALDRGIAAAVASGDRHAELEMRETLEESEA